MSTHIREPPPKRAVYTRPENGSLQLRPPLPVLPSPLNARSAQLHEAA